MDPNAALANARLTATLIRQALDADNAPDADQVTELLDFFEALDGWMSRGGFIPREWSGLR